jgi:DNA-binding NarL/FixJ family response regulator
LRVFLIGLAREDLDELYRRVAVDPALEIVGTALRRDIDQGRLRVPSRAEAVMLSPPAAARAAATADETTSAEHDPIEALTPRELDVLALLSDGHGNRAIAARLGISEHTVKFHLASIFGKLGASTRTEAVRRGLELGLIEI